MTRLDVNRSGEIEVFVRVVDLGGFSAAAQQGGHLPARVRAFLDYLTQHVRFP